MFRAEIRKYVLNRMFFYILAIGLLILAVYTVLLAGAVHVGLTQASYFDFIIGALNMYSTVILPFIGCIVAAYLVLSEYQWRTLIWTAFDRVPRYRWIIAKVEILVLSLLVWLFVYFVATVILALLVFHPEEVFVEYHALSVGEAILRTAFGGMWIALIIVPFGCISILMSLVTRNMVVSGLAGAFSYYLLLMSQNMGNHPLTILFQVARGVVRSADVLTGAFLTAVAQGVLIIVGLTGVIVYLAVVLFQRQDLAV